MKKVNKISFLLCCLGSIMILTAILLQYKSFQNEKKNNHYEKISLRQESDDIERLQEETLNPLESIPTFVDVVTIPIEPIVYDQLTLNQLAEKLNRTLKAELVGQGQLIASYSLQLGIDPYIATAIILHETGCNSGRCSSLVKNCHNVGGQKGGPSCGGGAYKAYASLEEGIIGYLDNLYKNYVSKGLTTVEAMASRYAASPNWPARVNNYVHLIKNQ